MNIVEKVDDQVKINHILVSTFDKSGLERLIPGLIEINPRLIIFSTGGTYRAIAGILGGKLEHLHQVSEYTGQPEMQGGLVKTLDFKIYLGILSETYNEAHRADLERAQAASLDLVVANLYPFSQTISQSGVTVEQARANIDIGGPCMIRAAAKNYLRVASLVDPADYKPLLEELRAGQGSSSLKTRYRLAWKAFAHTAEYDSTIARYLAECSAEQASACYKQGDARKEQP